MSDRDLFKILFLWILKKKGLRLLLLIMALSILGTPLKSCSFDPLTGYARSGSCDTCGSDVGNHIVCAVMTDKFLEFSMRQGNDLLTPSPENDFPGLKEGDRWCICLNRWIEAYEAGVAPNIVLEATHVAVTEHLDFAVLKAYSS